MLIAGRNQISGNIPTGISTFVTLVGFGFEENFFSVVVPFQIGKLRNLEILTFSTNKLSGPIPESFGNLTRIYALVLSENNLNGTIPSSIENIMGLQTMDLSHNFLTGPIPQTVDLFSTSTFMRLAHNAFIGVLPLEIGKLNNLQELDVSENKLSGHIPTSLGNCLKLEVLLLEGNMFQGSIPLTFSSLKGIESLDLSRNNLSSQISKDLAALVLLKNLNLSFNNLAGEVPLHGVFGNLKYGIGGRTSTEGDVYSYGILLLEMLTGKRPTDELFTIRQSLHEFCKEALPERVMETVDSRMLLVESTDAENDAQKERFRRDKTRECPVSLVRIGIACSAESPSKRMIIKDVIIGLMEIKEVFLGIGIHGKRQMRMRLTGEGTS
ncbi:hypothetical protein RHSIM_Rhsim09G0175900 [Rhododendron simsii]|uniref:Uncharacterized protein n=1 Tax=Rhododendron simsii TaxID=118357 RepID=A0A834GJA5_RHOSS|nr:hypothetical protein RHSIM_Rhsim09G0175900 [Rhododendron simsii]